MFIPANPRKTMIYMICMICMIALLDGYDVMTSTTNGRWLSAAAL